MDIALMPFAAGILDFSLKIVNSEVRYVGIVD